jgi:hypothetical protein
MSSPSVCGDEFATSFILSIYLFFLFFFLEITGKNYISKRVRKMLHTLKYILFNMAVKIIIRFVMNHY